MGDPAKAIVRIRTPVKSNMFRYQRCPNRFHVTVAVYTAPSSVGCQVNGATLFGTKAVLVVISTVRRLPPPPGFRSRPERYSGRPTRAVNQPSSPDPIGSRPTGFEPLCAP